MEQMYNQILAKIKEYHKIIIFGHIRPDGDCYGSQFGLKNIILTNFPDKEVYVVGEKCDYVSFLGQMDELKEEDYQNFLGIVVDTATQDRISDQRFNKASYLIKMDHHVEVDKYGDISLALEFPAAAAIIANFAKELGLNLNHEGAFALYTGIVTDTGRFKFGKLNQVFFETVAFLASYNIDTEYLDELLSTETLEELLLKGYVLQNIKRTEHKVAYFIMDKKIMNQFNVSESDAAALVSTIGTIKDSPVYFFLIEYDDSLRLRIRSRGPRIDLLANKYNGGGHMKASGAQLMKMEDLNQFLKDIDQVMVDYLEEQNEEL